MISKRSPYPLYWISLIPKSHRSVFHLLQVFKSLKAVIANMNKCLFRENIPKIMLWIAVLEGKYSHFEKWWLVCVLYLIHSTMIGPFARQAFQLCLTFLRKADIAPSNLSYLSFSGAQLPFSLSPSTASPHAQVLRKEWVSSSAHGRRFRFASERTRLPDLRDKHKCL